MKITINTNVLFLTYSYKHHLDGVSLQYSSAAILRVWLMSDITGRFDQYES